MQIIVSSIPESGIEKEFRLPILLEDIGLMGDVRVFLKAVKFDSTVLVDGKVWFEAQTICSRCLKEFAIPVEASFRAEYLPGSGSAGEKEHELSETEMDVNTYRDDTIDIEDLIREQILLAVPMKSLCSEDCKGLCLKCGKDLNEAGCGCGPVEEDPGFAPLKKLKESLGKK